MLMPELWGMILAAGESKRMKVPKLLLPYYGKTMIEKVIENVSRSGINKIVVVLGSGRDGIMEVIRNLAVETCFNPDYKLGMLSSIKCGFRSLPETSDSVLIFLGDQPMIREQSVDEVIQAYNQSGKGIVIPVYKHKRGHPILIDRRYRDEIEKLDDREGLRALAYKFAADVYEVEVENDCILRDIDTREEYINELNQIQ